VIEAGIAFAIVPSIGPGGVPFFVIAAERLGDQVYDRTDDGQDVGLADLPETFEGVIDAGEQAADTGRRLEGAGLAEGKARLGG